MKDALSSNAEIALVWGTRNEQRRSIQLYRCFLMGWQSGCLQIENVLFSVFSTSCVCLCMCLCG